MTRWASYHVLSAIAVFTASSAFAMTASECTRTTHVSHGGEADHVDLGEGRVMWRDWWSQEGSATDIVIADCQSGDVLQFRTAEENMNKRPPFDRTEDAMAIVAQHETGARVFATLGRMSDDLKKVARDVSVEVWALEPCACAAFYPGLRGDKEAFRLEGL
ncbi:hypothetical protein [Roseobacter litoralis]|uniref:Uncharacterized protein n=1 Tax=Roseobacter litoralis (strain ATCC 49566 / DSM 6996 / JCM 21268 / NBRC 15278 / OCh 149) TaxID=391595 RepID=F7ZCN5_ROSLO|nr:hypothetical protein [Roseobacter litoralis]AEI94459.1 hypothetical protein RLO149_c024910 [Roseobacter litoralis Och 149]